jgi:hypothetical protein
MTSLTANGDAGNDEYANTSQYITTDLGRGFEDIAFTVLSYSKVHVVGVAVS